MKKLKVEQINDRYFTNLVSETYLDIRPDEIERKISEFENRLHILELSYKKVLIAKASGTKISSYGDITMDYELMVELNRKPPFMLGLTFQESYRVEKSIGVLFKGESQYLHLAATMLDIYIYENDLLDLGILYTLFYEEKDNEIKVEYIKPIEVYDSK